VDVECDADNDCSKQKKEDARLAEERQRLKWQKDHMYDDMLTEDQMQMSSNQDRDEDFLDDFM
jgi:hypothetical protein